MMKCVTILGSTGSIGRQSLDIISRMPEVKVSALTGGTNYALMAEQVRKFRPELAVMADIQSFSLLQELLGDELEKTHFSIYNLL